MICVCMCACIGEEIKMVRGVRGELPDLKRQIRPSLKSITGEPCTDFISWQMCAAKGMQTDIDVWDWLISSLLKNIHTELQCRVCFGFVCSPSANSILNIFFPWPFSKKNKLTFVFICWKLIPQRYKMELLGQMASNVPLHPDPPLPATKYFFHKI